MEQGNLRQALGWTCEQREVGLAAELAYALYWFWVSRSYLGEGRGWYERVLALCENREASPQGRQDIDEDLARAQALYGAAGMAWLQGDHPAAKRLAAECVGLWRTFARPLELAHALVVLGLAERSAGELDKARAVLEEGLTLFEQAGDRWGLAFGRFCLGLAAMTRRELVLAETLLAQSVADFRVLGDRWAAALTLGSSGDVAYLQGYYARAAERIEEGLAIFRERADTRSIAIWSTSLGDVARSLGDGRRAEIAYREGLALFRELGHRPETAGTLYRLAMALLERGERPAAAALLAEALALFEAAGNGRGLAFCLAGAAGTTGGERAARLLGAAETAQPELAALLPPANRADYEECLAAARAALGEEKLRAAWQAGLALSLADAIAEARAVLAEAASDKAKAVKSADRPAASGHDRIREAGLTTREVDVLRLVAEGLTNAGVAERLVLSPLTVNAYLRSIYSKLGVSSRSAATRWAITNGVVE
jgi:ATP/maltotriose-dependent transcriptional regulator MalT